jgi:hypothetical protein
MSFLHLQRNFNNLFELTKTPEETYHALNMPEVEAEEDYDDDLEGSELEEDEYDYSDDEEIKN